MVRFSSKFLSFPSSCCSANSVKDQVHQLSSNGAIRHHQQQQQDHLQGGGRNTKGYRNNTDHEDVILVHSTAAGLGQYPRDAIKKQQQQQLQQLQQQQLQQDNNTTNITSTPAVTIIHSTKQQQEYKDNSNNNSLNNLEPFPKHGLKLSYILYQFINNCGGRNKLQGMTTTDVCNVFVKPITEKYKSSYCDMLLIQRGKGDGGGGVDTNNNKHRPSPPNVVGEATVFISHAWQYKFLDVLDALKDHFCHTTPHVIIWFDLFSNNQHKAASLPYEWWQTVFSSAIQEFGHTVMVMSPWDNPIPYTRAWCIFEAYCTCKTNSKFEVAMSAVEKKDFVEKTMDSPTDTIETMLGTINAKKSEATNAKDKEQIFQVISEEVGFHRINSMVFEQMRDWVISVGEKELRNENNHNGLRYWYLLNMVAALYESQGTYDAAEPLYVECLEKSRALLGDDHPSTLTSINNLAVLYKSQGTYDAAEPLYVDCLEKRRALLGDDHPDTLASINNLAVLYESRGKYDAAEPLYVDCLEKRRALLGDDHPDTLTSINNLAGLYESQGTYDAAEPLYVECLEKRRAVLGDDHPSTLTSINNLAVLYESIKGDS